MSVRVSSFWMRRLVTLNDAVLLPAAWTDAGILTCALLEASWILTPAAGAAPDSINWQATLPPPVRV